jgi:type I restriction enzyme M protein
VRRRRTHSLPCSDPLAGHMAPGLVGSGRVRRARVGLPKPNELGSIRPKCAPARPCSREDDLSRRTAPRDPLGRYYTSDDVGDLLISLLGASRPERVIDLGCGPGALCQAARRRWARAEIVTVDIDRRAGVSCSLDLGASHQHLRLDALSLDLPRSLAIAAGGGPDRFFDAAVCNPPYIRPRWRRSFSRILEEAGLDDVASAMGPITADVLFLAQNLRLLRSGGRVGLIVPDGFITGRQTESLRRALLAEHRVLVSCALPRSVFAGTDARAHILVLEKGASVNATEVRITELTHEGLLLPALMVPTGAAIERLDYGFHAHRQRAFPARARGPSISLGSLGAEVARGKLTGAQARATGAFHTSSFPRDLASRRAVLLPSKRLAAAASSKAVQAEAGDILIARVDRDLAQKVCLVASGSAPLSDCVLRLRLAPKWRDQVFTLLASHSGKAWLDAIAKGVGARHITARDLLECPLPWRVLRSGR